MIRVVGLDTTFLSDFLRRDPSVSEYLAAQDRMKVKLVTTSLNAAELYHGAAGSARRPEMLREIESLLDDLVVLPLNREASRLAGELAYELRTDGRPIPFADLLIAAILLAHGEAVVVTRNDRHFKRVPGLVVVRY